MKLNQAQQEELYNEVEGFFTLSDNLVDELSKSSEPNRQRNYVLVKPVIDEVEVLSHLISDYIIKASKEGAVSVSDSKNIENCFMRVFAHLENFANKVGVKQ